MIGLRMGQKPNGKRQKIDRQKPDHAPAVDCPAEDLGRNHQCERPKRKDSHQRQVIPAFDLGEMNLMKPESRAESRHQHHGERQRPKQRGSERIKPRPMSAVHSR